MISITLLSQRHGDDDWFIRNRLGRHLDGSNDLQAARRLANLYMARWIAVEPYTEFRIEELRS